MIDVKHVDKRYGTFHAVRDVSFHVGGGEIVGLLGPNGAGKTTLMKILTCYHFPSGGTATLDGNDVFENPIAIKRLVGYLPENAPVYSDLTVMEYLDFIGRVRYPNVAGGNRERIDWAIAECGLEQMVHRTISKLSKGYRQRTGLAQAILHDPSILILDEPTSGLDPNQILEIRNLIRRLGEKKTVILSTHILQEVEAVCDRVLILNGGRIVAEGTTEEIGREVKGEDLYVLTIKTPDGTPAPTEMSLASIRGVSSVARFEPLRPEHGAIFPGQFIAHLSMHPDRNNAETIFDWAVDNGLKLLSLNRERISLEDIFARLTMGTESPAADAQGGDGAGGARKGGDSDGNSGEGDGDEGGRGEGSGGKGAPGE